MAKVHVNKSIALNGSMIDRIYSCGADRIHPSLHTHLDMEVVPARWVCFQPHGYPNGSDVSLFLEERSPFWSRVKTLEKENEIVNFRLQK